MYVWQLFRYLLFILHPFPTQRKYTESLRPIYFKNLTMHTDKHTFEYLILFMVKLHCLKNKSESLNDHHFKNCFSCLEIDGTIIMHLIIMTTYFLTAFLDNLLLLQCNVLKI